MPSAWRNITNVPNYPFELLDSKISLTENQEVESGNIESNAINFSNFFEESDAAQSKIWTPDQSNSQKIIYKGQKELWENLIDWSITWY